MTYSTNRTEMGVRFFDFVFPEPEQSLRSAEQPGDRRHVCHPLLGLDLRADEPLVLGLLAHTRQESG